MTGLRLQGRHFAGLMGITLAILTPACSQAGEWVSLFDGKTLSGWTQGGGEGKSNWEVEDGAIVGSGGASMLYSPKGDYKNFRFRAEIKINDNGNSGMYFRTPEARRASPRATRPRSTAPTATRSGPARSTLSSTSTSSSSRPTPGSPRRSRSSTRTTGARWSRTSRSRSTASCSTSSSTTTKTWNEGHFAFQQHDPGSKVEIRKIEVMELPSVGK